MFRALALLPLLVFAQSCSTACKTNADCADGNQCVVDFSVCRKTCQQPADCSGDTFCSPLPNGLYACLKSTEIPRATMTTSTDTSLGNQCQAPKNDGVSQPNVAFGACGDGAPLCNRAFGNDPDLDIETCTVECNTDSDCAAKAPTSCTGDCKAQYDNMACFPSLPLNAAEQISGAKRKDGMALTLFCRPRLLGYFVPKRCTLDLDCGKAGSRAGDKCTKTADSGGSCLSGKLGMYECCQREGECDKAPGGDITKLLHCQNASDNLSGYCSRKCTTDAECQGTGVPAGSSCWDTIYQGTATAGQCTVVQLEPGNAICRPGPKPVIPVPATKVVACGTPERPVEKADNKYDSSLRACARTF